jgi:hypothetical protein
MPAKLRVEGSVDVSRATRAQRRLDFVGPEFRARGEDPCGAIVILPCTLQPSDRFWMDCHPHGSDLLPTYRDYAQIAVEPDFQLIVGQRVTQASNDKQQLKPTVEAIGEQAGQKPQEGSHRQRIARRRI